MSNLFILGFDVLRSSMQEHGGHFESAWSLITGNRRPSRTRSAAASVAFVASVAGHKAISDLAYRPGLERRIDPAILVVAIYRRTGQHFEKQLHAKNHLVIGDQLDGPEVVSRKVQTPQLL